MSLRGCEETLPPVDSLRVLYEASLLREPSSIALVDVSTDERLTFKQFSICVNKFARFLQNILSRYDKNANPDGDRVVAVCIPPSIDLIVCLFAIMQVKGAYLPLDVDFPSSRVNHILEDAKPQLLIVRGHQPATAHLRNNFIDGVKMIDIEERRAQIKSEDESIFIPNEEDLPTCDVLAAILYTSGSTGVPKGVRIPENAVLNRLIWQWRAFPYHHDEVCCFKTALTFVDSISEIFGPLLTGHRLLIIPKSMTREVESLVDVLDKHKVGRLVLVPSLLRSILLHCSRTKGSLPHLRLWVCSGEIFPPDLLYSFFETFRAGQKICNFYGSTEVLGDVTFIQFDNSDDLVHILSHNKVPIGKPISNVNIYLVDKDLNEVTKGKVGELLVAGLNLALGYVGNAETDKFIPNPHCSKEGYNILYRTGDYASASNGQLIFEGRTDSQLKVRGHRVDLSEIEATIQTIRGIEKCHVACYRLGEIDQEILAFYTTSDNDIDANYMKLRISSTLPVYMHPKFVKIEEMPHLVNGKIDRQRLLKMHEDFQFTKSLEEATFDLTECKPGKEEMGEALLRCLTRVLGSSAPSTISLNQNFFNIGGNSLNSVLAITSFQDAGYQIGITDFLKAKTLNDVLNLAEKSDDEPFKENEFKVDILGTEKLGGYKCFPLQKHHKDVVIRMIARSFVEKGDLEVLLHIRENEYNNVMEQIWEPTLKHNLSFVVCREVEEDVVAISLNMDLYMEPDINFPSKNMKNMFEFLEECETEVKFCLPEGIGKVVHSVMMATDEYVTPVENVSLIQVMEEENIVTAQKNGYEAIFTTNTSELTQHICDDLLRYRPLASYQVNQWMAEDGTRPFSSAPDSLCAVCSAYYVNEDKQLAEKEDV